MALAARRAAAALRWATTGSADAAPRSLSSFAGRSAAGAPHRAFSSTAGAPPRTFASTAGPPHRAFSSTACAPARTFSSTAGAPHRAFSSTGLANPAARIPTPRSVISYAFPSPAGHFVSSPLGSRAALLSTVSAGTYPSLKLELTRLDVRGFGRCREIADAIQQLSIQLSEDEAATVQFLTEHIIHVGTVVWRVCTTVLTVAVAAGFGVLHLSKPGWEEEFHNSACSTITSRLAEARVELDQYMVKTIVHRRKVAAAHSFLKNGRTKEKRLAIVQREAHLDARESALAAREAVLAAK